MTKQLPVGLPDDMYEAVRNEAHCKHLSMAEVVRRALAVAFEDELSTEIDIDIDIPDTRRRGANVLYKSQVNPPIDGRSVGGYVSDDDELPF